MVTGSALGLETDSASGGAADGGGVRLEQRALDQPASGGRVSPLKGSAQGGSTRAACA